MHVCLERQYNFGFERGSVQPHREDIVGAWVRTDCLSTFHVFTLTEVEASESQLQCIVHCTVKALYPIGLNTCSCCEHHKQEYSTLQPSML